MTTTAKRALTINFGAGALIQSARDLIDYKDTGMGIVEMSHRSKLSAQLMDDSIANLRSLLDIPEDYSIIFMQGGGTTQFAAVVYNMLAHAAKTKPTQIDNLKIDYVVTGSWSKKAAIEAARLYDPEKVRIVADSKKRDGKYGDIVPEIEWNLSPAEETAFAYYCDNETIDGVEFPAIPQRLVNSGVPIVCDMSSNFISRKVDVSKFSVIFAGAQKNVGPAGLTIAIIKNDVLQNRLPDGDASFRKHGIPIAPITLDYKVTADNKSLYNTIPLFTLHLCNLVVDKLLQNGGMSTQQTSSDRKAALIYQILTASPKLFLLNASEGCRSRMNIPFRIGPSDDLENKFLKGAEERGLVQLKGHRSVGGKIAYCIKT